MVLFTNNYGGFFVLKAGIHSGKHTLIEYETFFLELLSLSQ